MSDPVTIQRGEAVCARILAEIEKLGFSSGQVQHTPDFKAARFEVSKDPYSGQDTICAFWQNERGYKVGQLKFHGDGSFYAEYDVALPHPTDPRWFVEGVLAWGRDDVIKSEAKLLPVPEE